MFFGTRISDLTDSLLLMFEHEIFFEHEFYSRILFGTRLSFFKHTDLTDLTLSLQKECDAVA